jgi:hypothetical protein
VVSILLHFTTGELEDHVSQLGNHVPQYVQPFIPSKACLSLKKFVLIRADDVAQIKSGLLKVAILKRRAVAYNDASNKMSASLKHHFWLTL